MFEHNTGTSVAEFDSQLVSTASAISPMLVASHLVS
jgi:hypothetical protein